MFYKIELFCIINMENIVLKNLTIACTRTAISFTAFAKEPQKPRPLWQPVKQALCLKSHAEEI
jgi:hypothetical protein